ncbi:metal-dependent protein hydrolase [Haematococcus lacustris]
MLSRSIRRAVYACVSHRSITSLAVRGAPQCMSKRPMVRIGTHSGSFHCDEALGCWLLHHTNDFKDAEIVRSRDPAVLKDCDIVIDVGGVYSPETHRYDHHQREFSDKFGHGFTCTKLSSAGLVYRHFGREVLANILGIPVDHPDMETIYLQVYKTFIEAVDAVDNGVNQWDSSEPPKYINTTTLGARVGQLNPKWNEDSSESVLYAQFLKAVQLTGAEFREAATYVHKTWLPGYAKVKESLEQRLSVDPSGRILKLLGFCPWKEHLYNLEKELAVEAPILFCLYEDDREKAWRIQAVSIGPGSFENRRSLPAAWRGLRDDKLSEVAGIPGCVFVHASGFIGGAKTEEGVLAMARAALTLD